jgi:hypothetical protein
MAEFQGEARPRSSNSDPANTRPTPDAWDARVERALLRAPARLRAAVHWLRAPSRFWFRLVAGILLILGGILAILPIFGLWMLPLGLALIADDVPGLKCRLEQAACWLERIWHRLRRPRSKHKPEFSESGISAPPERRGLQG